MAHELDIQRITASVFKHINDSFTGVIHWPGTEGADDTSWVEPWMNVELQRGRTNDWLYLVTLTINVFTKEANATYTIHALAGEIVSLFKAIKVQVKSYDAILPALPVVKGCVSFKEPESIDMGEQKKWSGGATGRVGLRQVTVRCDGIVYPLAA